MVPDISANIEWFLSTRLVEKEGLEIPSAISEFALIFTPYGKILHSYLVLSVMKFALGN